MANPTTNYGWVLPTPTDLVTDLPADFDVALQGVDTTTKALNPSTTLGDIEYRSSTANTNTRLGIGSTGQVLTVAGGVPSWATSSSGGMTLISTTTLSGATVTLSSIPQTYVSLYLVVTGVTFNTSNKAFRLLPNNVNNLATFNITRNQAAGSAELAVTQNNLINLGGGQDLDRTSALNSWIITIDNYASTNSYKMFTSNGSFITASAYRSGAILHGVYQSNTAISSLVFDVEGVNTFSAGTVLLYGVK